MPSIDEQIAKKEREIKELKKKKVEAIIKQKVSFFDRLSKELSSNDIFREKFINILEEYQQDNLKEIMLNSLKIKQE